jgi:allantoate deiminase
VEAINGARRLNCRFTGEAGHAGTVPMNHRKDALAAAAEWMVIIENATRQQGGNRWRRLASCAACRGR